MRSTLFEPHAPGWPVALAALDGPPPLYLCGALPAARGVAVVGTREPSEAALAFTRALALGLSDAGFSVWSGGARGVDAAAHEAALEAGAPTVVVVGGGLARPYPREHAPLYARVVAAGGAIVARLPDDTPPMPATFLLRNQVLAALTVATVLVEAGLVSGARSTAAAARRLGRPLFVVPHAPWDPRGRGCAEELARGGAIAIRDAEDVVRALSDPAQLALLALPPAPVRSRGRASRAPSPARGARPTSTAPAGPSGARPLDERLQNAPLSPAERAILAAIEREPTHLDGVCEATGLGLPAVTEALLTLTLAAVVVEGPAGFFRRVSRS